MTIETFTADDAVSALALVETHLGEEAFILSMDLDGAGVVVRAATHAPAGRDMPSVPVSSGERAAFRPRFLDPARPKPFPERAETPAASKDVEKSMPTKPHKLVFRSRFAPVPALPEPDMAEAARAAEEAIKAARYIVVATHGAKAPFAITIELLRKFPRARVLRWQEGQLLPWVDETADFDGEDDEPIQPTIVLCRAAGQTFTDVMVAAGARKDVAYLLLLESDLRAETFTAIGDRGAISSVTGTILLAKNERPSLDTIRAVAERGLVPVWTLHQSKLCQLFDGEDAAPSTPKLKFLRHSAHAPPPRVGAA